MSLHWSFPATQFSLFSSATIKRKLKFAKLKIESGKVRDRYTSKICQTETGGGAAVVRYNASQLLICEVLLYEVLT